jgi:hypothetical protein
MAFISAPAPVGYDPARIFPSGPDGSDVAALHLRPYRVQVGRATALARGEKPRLWQPEARVSRASGEDRHTAVH